MKLDERFRVEQQSSTSCTLYESVDGFKLSKDRKTRIPTKVEKESYYGTIYQALQGYLKLSVGNADSVKDVRKIAVRVMNTLDELEAEIKEKFCCYVRKA